MPGDISIPDKDRTIITITRKEQSLTNESLGIHLTCTGNQDKQKKVLKKKSEIFSAQVSKKLCNKTAALWTFQYSFMHHCPTNTPWSLHSSQKMNVKKSSPLQQGQQ